MKKLILIWLFGTDDIKSYIELLSENLEYTKEYMRLINDHIKTLEKHKEDIDIIRKLIKICEKHGINVDEEIKHIKLHDVNCKGE